MRKGSRRIYRIVRYACGHEALHAFYSEETARLAQEQATRDEERCLNCSWRPKSTDGEPSRLPGETVGAD